MIPGLGPLLGAAAAWFTSDDGKPGLGAAAREMATPVMETPSPLLVKPVEAEKPAPKEIRQTNTFAPHLAITVQGDVKDPHELANQLMPYLQRMQADAQARQQADSLFDAPNL